MSLRIRGSALFLSVLFFVLCGWGDLESDLQDITDNLVDLECPGALLYVADPVLGTNALAAGVRNTETGTAAQPTDRFRIASNSKSFTAAAILLLRDEGNLSLTNTVADLLPAYDIPSNDVITVWNLLTHTSGLPDQNNDTDYFEEQLFEDPSTYFSPDDIFAVVRSLTNHFAVGAEYKYCDTGYYILHLIIDQHNTNGWSYADFIRNRLIQPLGLTNTFVPDAGNDFLRVIPGAHLDGYLLVDEESGATLNVTEVNQSNDIGCGGMVSSTEDLTKWIAALHGGAVLNPASRAELQEITTQSRQAGVQYGMATMYNQYLGFGHSGVTAGYISWMFYDPVRQTAYATVISLESEDLIYAPMMALLEAKRALGYGDIEDLRYSNTIAQVSTYITNQMAKNDMPSLAIALVDSNQVVWARGFGLADIEAGIEAHSDTKYALCSISKTFAAAAILQLQEDALLDLDDPVTNYVPSFSLLPRFGVAPITIRQLLNHASGIPGSYWNRAQAISPDTGFHTFMLQQLAKDYPNFPPNFVNAYNNNGFTLVEDVVAAVAGTNYPAFVSENLLAPMGMLGTTYFGAEPVARSYKNGVRYPNEILNVPAAGGVYSSVLDMGQYIQTLLAWGVSPKDLVVLESNSVAALWRDETTNLSVSVSDKSFRAGLGWDCIADPEFEYAGVAQWKCGASDTFGGLLEVIPERGLGVIVLNNYPGNAISAPVAWEALRWALKEKFNLDWPTNRFVPTPSQVTNLPIAELDAVTGCYAAAEGYDLVQRDGTNLVWILNAQSESPTAVTNIGGRENGWFSRPTSQDFEICFSNVAGHFVMYIRQLAGTYTNYQETSVRGERITPIALSAAWSNRLDRPYFVSDLVQDSYYWLPAYDLSLLMLQREGAIFLQCGLVADSLFIPDSDSLAFPRGIGYEAANATALQAFTTGGVEYLRYGGFTYRAADTFPAMDAGTASNLTLAAGETVWFTLTVESGTVYTLDLTSTNQASAYLQDADGNRIGHALSAFGYTFTATTNGEYRIAVVNGDFVGPPVQFGAWTNALPFYRVVTNAAERPPFMTNQWYGGSEFGYVYVPASRVTNDAHSYRIPVLQLASGPEATNGAMVYLSGGPGSSAINQPFMYRAFTNTVRVILMNQRGAYLSQPNLFPLDEDESTAGLQQRLGGPDGMDFNTINTRENAADVHDVMTVLGNNPFNVWGTSYGTMLSQEVIRQHPERIRAAVLDGVVKLDEPQWTMMGQAFYDAVQALTNDIGRDADANRLYPDFGGTLMDFAAGLYPDDYHDFFDGFFHQMNLSRWGRAEDLPGVIWRASRGEMAALAGLGAINAPVENPPPDGPMSGNMYALVLRHDMLPYESMTNAAALTNSIPFPLNRHGYAYSQDQFDSSEDWAFVTPVDASFRTAVTDDVPVLVLNGRYDTQTPLSGAKHVATNLPQVYYVELPYIGHVVLFGGDVPTQIGRDFLTNPNVFPDTNGITGLSLTFTPPWPTNDATLSVGATETNEWEWNGLGAVGEWYKFAATAGESYALEVQTPDTTFTLNIVDTNAEVLADGDEPALTWYCPETGDYYAWLVGDGTGAFTVALSGITNDLVEGESVTGELAAAQTAWFHCSTVSGQYYGIVVTGNTANLSIQLVGSSLGFVTNRSGDQLGWTSGDSGYDVGLSSTGDTPFVVRFYSFSNTIAQATQWIGEQMTNSGVVGLSVALVDGQEIAWAQGFGFADRENGIPVTTDTVFRIGSISKMFTTTAAMQYRDQGKLGLDDSVTNYLPGLRLLDRGGFPGTEAIAVRDLLDHHSGLPGNLFNSYFTTEPLGDRYAWHTNYLAGAYPIYPPRQVYSYCNTAFVLMEGVIEAVDGSGTAFTTLVNSNLFEPLGMDASSYLKDKPDIINNLAKPYSGGQLMPEEYVNAYGTGGMYSRPIDLANYIRMVLAGGIAPDGTRILEAESVAEMLTPQATNTPFAPFIVSTVGLGWDSVKWPTLSYAGDLAWKNGQTFAYSANLSVLPERNIGFVIVVNALADFAIATPDLILQHAVNDKYGIPAPTNMVYFPTATQTVSQAELDALAGIYAAAHGYHRVVANPGSLTLFASAVHSNMLFRTDGWFTPADDAPTTGMLFTNLAGRTTLVWRAAHIGFATTNVLGERFDPVPISAAWSNRLEKLWFALDESPVSYYPYLDATPCLTFATNDGVLLVRADYANGSCVLSPTNDDTAFICGLMSEADSAVQVFTSNSFEYLRFGGWTWQPAESFPVLYPGSMTNLSLAAGETRWFAVPGWTGDPQGVIVTDAFTSLSFNLYTPDGDPLADGINAAQWICPTNGTYYLSVGAMSDTSGNLRAYSLTNTIAVTRSAVTGYMARFNIQGVSVAVVDGDQIAWIEHFGFADKEEGTPVDGDTVFMIGSLSKTLTTLTALQLFDEGALDLDASVTDYIPEFSLLPRFAGFPTNITSRNMLDHHSGLPGDIYNGAVSPIADYWPGYTAWMLDYFREDYALNPPDTIASYCNSGFNIVAEIVARLDGADFPASAEARLLGPLEMTHSSFAPDKAAVLDNLATGYVDGTNPVPPQAMNMPATGGAFSRVEDIAHVISLLLNEGIYGGAEVLTTNALAQMDRKAALPLDVSNYLQPGLGLDTAADAVLAYAGRTWAKNGSIGFFESYLEVLPDQGLGCIALMNTSPNATYGIVRAALHAALEEKAGLVKPAIPPMDFTPTNRPQAELLPMEGLYVIHSGPGQFVAETNGTLTGITIGLISNTVSTGYQALVNGRFSVPGLTNLQVAFTNIAGQDLMISYGDDGGVASEMIYERNMQAMSGSRFAPPAVPAAWSNRVGVEWIVCNPFADDVAVLMGEPAMCTLHLTNGILRFIGTPAVTVLAPADDDTAYVAGLVTRAGGAVRVLQTNGSEQIQFSGYRYMRLDDVPGLTPGVPVSGTNLFHQGNWYYADLPAGTFTLACSDTNITMLFYTDLDSEPEVASGTHTFALTSPGTVYIALVTLSATAAYELDAGRATLQIDEAQATPAGMVLSWISQPGTNYAIEVATNLLATPAFLPCTDNIPSVAGIRTTWTAAPPTGPGAYYRVMEEQP